MCIGASVWAEDLFATGSSPNKTEEDALIELIPRELRGHPSFTG